MEKLNKKLAIVIHTEEEFDWAKGFYRSNTGVSHAKELTEFCESLIAVGAKITFALDYAFVKSEEGKKLIQHFLPLMNNAVEFAAHLHPWVTPPFNDSKEPISEPINGKFSFPGNLSKDEEYNKLSTLTEAIVEQTSQRPSTYLAGRYGIGENTASILSQLGYKTDLSISPFADFSPYQGPDFSLTGNHAYESEGIKNIPHSTGLVSSIPALSKILNNNAQLFKKLNNTFFGKVLFKLCRVDRYRLSPEGFNVAQMKQVTKTLVDSGISNLVFSFHSPSAKRGMTPYVESEPDHNKLISDTQAYVMWLKTNTNIDFSLSSELDIK